MGFTVDIDTGGTFTDGFIANGQEFRTVKTLTTPHDLTLCFMECIKSAAQAFAMPLPDFLAATEIIRFSNTIGTNSIIVRDGARIGMIVSAGHEALAPTTDAAGKRPLINADMVAGIAEEVGADGSVVLAPTDSAVLAAAQRLIDDGARCLVVALHRAELNPVNEKAVRGIIKREYPRDYLGSVPVFISADLSSRSGYLERINTAALNAYIHGKLTRLLYKAGEDLRRNDYPGQLLIGHNNGAVARVAKTRAINTYNSGPAAGLLGARRIGELYGAGCVISGDMGGTSFDIGYIENGELEFALRPDVEGFPCNLPMLAIRALGAGGGSIARVDQGVLHVGPESAGALPGPVCFDLGGSEPTVTDANLVLGLLDPDYFLGGAKRLNKAAAYAAIERKIAVPLGIPVDEAARRIKATIDAHVAADIQRLLAARRPAAPPLMVVYGGAGPLHCCEIAAAAGIDRLVVTPFSAVFSAFSSSLMDVGHLYYRRLAIDLRAPGDFAPVREALGAMRARAETDMRGEGFAPDVLRWSVEAILHDPGSGEELRVVAEPQVFEHGESAAATLAAAVRAANGDPARFQLSDIALRAAAAVPHFAIARQQPATIGLAQARRTERSVVLDDGPVGVVVYDRDRMGPGHATDGPAIIESAQTTIWVPRGWHARIDEFNNVVLDKAAHS